MTDVNSTNNKLVASSSEMPLLPLKDIVVFPNMIVPVFINEDLCINAVESAMAKQRKIFLSAFKVAGHDGEGLSATLEAPFDVYDIGTVCTIMRTRKLPDGRMKVLVQGLHKATVKELLESEPYPKVFVQAIQEAKVTNNSSEVEALIRSVRDSLEKVVALGKVLSPDILMILEDVNEPGRLADLVASNLGLKVQEAQGILAIHQPLDRLKKVYGALSREIEVYQMQVRIQSHAKDEIGRMQREHYLREQMRVIKSELGDHDPKDELDQYWQKMEALPLNKEAREELTRQVKRLERMHQDTSEAALTRTHIETVLALPWGKKSTDSLNLKKAKEILDDDHFGLEQVKDRILEYLAVKKLNPEAKSPIVCFVGPPGVGKTSLGRSIAKSMGREFARIALGGVRDEADIRGHRKTYVGAFPGRIAAALKTAGTSNPVIMLDEIDKMASDHRGDPSSALLEVLDPSQNHTFVDHYLGLPFDLSDIMFVANANTLDTIPAPLRDRLEIIDVSGYSEEEKLAIANQYLIPKQLKESGLDKANVVFTKNSVATIINGYTRESGLRTLDKRIGAVCRKLARIYAEQTDMWDQGEGLKLTPQLIQKHLGAQRYDDNFFHKEDRAGVSLGLAYTQYGGEVMAIECSLVPTGKHGMVLTGKLGEVMKESAQAALSFVRSHIREFGLDPEKLEKHELHIHVPAGAVPKDGPSAGIAMATAIISALSGKAPSRFAMTGEITIHGKVLPIGGLKEKLLAAIREGVKEVVLPEKNKSVYMELPVNVRKGLKAHFVKDYSEAFELLFRNTANIGGKLEVVESVGGSHELAS